MAKKIVCLTALLLLLAGLASAQNFVYTNDENCGRPNTVSGFSVASDGTLTRVPGSPFPTGGTGACDLIIGSNNITVSPIGDFLFASNTISNDVSVFSINTSMGALTPVVGSPFPISTSFGTGIALSATPDGKFLMAGDNGSTTVTVFKIAP